MKNAQNLAMDWSERKTNIGLENFVKFIEAIQQDAFESGVQKYRPAWAKAMDHIIDSPCHCKPEEQYEPCHRCQTLKTISELLEPSDKPTPNPLKSPSL